ncbi:glycoside hydrolase family 2 protein [Kutzneria albida]|uniref:Uncharacterized protein n=1 Tax=Kutzneria albida DSM 43870 TaxID=1449976 RepID=W5WN73_9PSEU|nr:sugar-binding domain-containing protein [Kutzneria albida]AHI02017.1 hypothetical protein KALB_8660 [Kutzneria albida DSM 43870]
MRIRRATAATLVGLLLLALVSASAATLTLQNPAAVASPTEAGQVSTIPGWRIASTASAAQGGELISSPGYDDRRWTSVPARSTVLGGLISAGKYPDLGYSTNLADKVDKQDFTVPWWYREEFTADKTPGTRTTLRLTSGVIPSAEVWVNGTRVAGQDTVAGAYPAHDFDVTDLLRAGTNAVAIKVFPADPDKQLVISFLDWSKPAPDNDMGVWRDVRLVRTGSVALSGARVLTDLAVPALDSADLTVKAEVSNLTGAPVDTEVSGSVGPMTFSKQVRLKAHETATVAFDPLHLADPKVWWPYQMGDQPLYHLDLTAKVGGASSDRASTDFGIREVQSSLNSAGFRQFTVNGKPFLVRGAGWASDLFLRYDPQRLTDQLSHAKDLGLNTIRLEGKGENDELFQFADRAGLMVLSGWECCTHWQNNDADKWSPQDHTVARASAETEGMRLRNHPSMLGFYIGSDQSPPPVIEKEYLDGLAKSDWQLPVMPSISSYGGELTGPSGHKGLGPYWWVPPNYWYGDQKGGAFGFEGENGPGPAIPDLESLKKMLSPAELDSLWQNPDAVQFHLSSSEHFDRLGPYLDALGARYGKPTGLEDFVLKSQLANYEANRAQFEAYGRNQSKAVNPSGGVIYWMLNNAWPTLYWHLFDYEMAPSGSYFGAKTALKQLHVQYSYDDRSIALVNKGLDEAPNLTVQATVFALDGTVLSDQNLTDLRARADGTTKIGAVPTPEGLSTTYFVRLLLHDADGNPVDRNVYWLSTKPDTYDTADSKRWWDSPQTGYADLTGLQQLGPAQVGATAASTVQDGTVHTTTTLTNSGGTVAFFLRATVTRGEGGPEIAPSTWSDDYVTLWPGESITLTADYRQAQLGATTPTVRLTGVNLPAQYVPAPIK